MRSFLFAATLLLTAAPLAAQDKPADPKPTAGEKDERKPNVSVTRGSGTFGGQTIAYTATTGETFLAARTARRARAIFSVSYVKDGTDPNRPVTFLFNGGPGSGSLWLHMGAFGPKRVAIPSRTRATMARRPIRIVDNPDSLLDVTDIVFIDPVGTGFSPRWAIPTPRSSGASPRMPSRSRSSSAMWLTRTTAGTRPNIWAAKAMAPPAPPPCVNELEGTYNDVALNGLLLISTILDFGAGADTGQ